MGLGDRRLVQALHNALRGGSAVRMPQVTRSQQDRSNAILNQVRRSGLVGVQIVAGDFWFVDYTADNSPQTEGWTRHASGDTTATLVSSWLGLNSLAGGTVQFTYRATDLSNIAGTVVAARLRIESGGSEERNRGFVLAIMDGTYQFAAWFRADGYNLDGQPHVDCDMSIARDIRLEVVRAQSRLYVDGPARQTGGIMGDTTEQLIVMGTYLD